MTAPIGTGRALGLLQSVVTGIDKFEMSPGTGSTAGFFGVTATAQPASSAQAALTAITAGAIGFATTAGFSAFTAQLENIRASLVLLGLLKGGA